MTNKAIAKPSDGLQNTPPFNKNTNCLVAKRILNNAIKYVILAITTALRTGNCQRDRRSVRAHCRIYHPLSTTRTAPSHITIHKEGKVIGITSHLTQQQQQQ